jgi:hypothetical protein
VRPGGDRRPGPGGGHGDAVELAGRGDAGQRVSFTWPDANAAWLSRLDGVDKVTRRGDAVEVAGSGPLAVRVAAALAGRASRRTTSVPTTPTWRTCSWP